MTRQAALSGVALAVLMLAAAPAQAQLITLGGGGSGGGSGVSVDLGGGGGTGGGLLGGGTGSTSGDITINGTTILDLDGDGVGDVLDLNGDGIGDQQIDADLFGPGDNGRTQLAIGTNDDGSDDVLLTLFGSGSGAQTANLNVLPGGTGGIGGVGGNGTDADVNLGLFGPGTGGGGGGAGGPDPTQTGSTGGGGGGGIFGPDGGGAGALPARPSAGTRVAAATPQVATDCFAPNEEQIAYLLNRGSYSAEVTAQWNAASEISLVPVNLCPDARAQIDAALDADADASYMQAAVAMNSRIAAELDPNFTAEDVLAVDQSGNQLTVYVY